MAWGRRLLNRARYTDPMASVRALTKVVTTAGRISGGAILTLEGKTDTDADGLGIVRPLLGTVARSIASPSRPDDETVQQIERFLTRLIRRYGTARRSLEALASGRRRHRLVSVEKTRSWTQTMSVAPSLVEPTLRRHAELLAHLTTWVREHDDVEAALDAYENWLDAPLTGFRDELEDTRSPAAAPADTAQATQEDAPEATGRESPAGATELAAGDDDEAPSDDELGKLVAGHTEQPLQSEAEDLHVILRMLSDKPALDTPAIRRPSSAQRAALERARSAENAYLRTAAAVAKKRFDLADAFLPALEGRVDDVSLHTLHGDRYFMESRFDDALEHYRAAHHGAAELYTVFNLAATLLRAHKGQRHEHYAEARGLIESARPEIEPSRPEWGRFTMLLAVAHQHDPSGNRAEHLERAIELLDEAVRTCGENTERDFAAELHLHLGATHVVRQSDDRASNVKRAVACFRKCAEVWTLERDPDNWVTMQHHLAHAWERMPGGERAKHLARAIEHWEAALNARSRRQHGVQWATIQNSLGNAWAQVPVGDHRANLLHAIECHAAALEVWTAEHRLRDWASTQSNLGNIWALLPAEGSERRRNIHNAIESYRAALEVRTRESSPTEWAATLNNLGSALLMLADFEGRAPLDEAVACFERALEVRQRDTHPLDWAKTQANLGNAHARLLDHGGGADAAQHAARHYDLALEVFTEEAFPRQRRHVGARKRAVQQRADSGA